MVKSTIHFPRKNSPEILNKSLNLRISGIDFEFLPHYHSYTGMPVYVRMTILMKIMVRLTNCQGFALTVRELTIKSRGNEKCGDFKE